MTNGLRILATLAIIVQCCVQEATPTAVYAESNDGPQGVHDSTTSLTNGLTAITAAAATQKGLSTTTTVPIPVSGVFESRSDGSTSTQINRGTTTSPTKTRASGPGFNFPGTQSETSNPNTTDIPPCCGNFIVAGPTSYETGPDGSGSKLGGFSVGGFDFFVDTPEEVTPAGETTGWHAVGTVVRLDPRALALHVENDLGFPPIALKANPDPGLAQLESWFWVANYGGEVRSQSGTQSETHSECRLNIGVLECRPVTTSITVDVRETPTLYSWDFGDGRTAQDGHPAVFATSRGLGRAYTDPYTPSYVEHKYELSSLKFYDAGGYPITLQITWAAEFRVNGGGWQGLGSVTGSFTSRHQVRESWPVIVNSSTSTGAVR
jgi:hypothetical protein